MPLLLAGPGVESHQRIPVEPVAGAIRSVKIGGRGAERQIYNPALRIHRQKAPDIRSRTAPPRVRRPGLRSGLARACDGVEGPQQFAGLRIPSANVAVSA